MSLIMNEDPTVGGQVPLLKHAVMAWLQAHDTGKEVSGDTYAIAGATRAAVPNVTRALYDLQKQGLVTFRERKNGGAAGHHQTVLTHFELTERGKAWTKEKGALSDMAHRDDLTADDFNPAFVDEVNAERVAEDMQRDATSAAMATVHEALKAMHPALALERVLKARGRPMHIIRELNPILGYDRASTAVYSLARSYPHAFRIQQAQVSLIGEVGEVKDQRGGPKPRVRHAEQPEQPEPSPVPDEIRQKITGAYLEGRAVEAHLHQPYPLPELGPEITTLMAREAKRMKVAEAVAALEAAGLEDDALTVMGRIPDDSPLEREVITLVKELHLV